MDRSRAGQIQGGVIVLGVGVVFLLANFGYLPSIRRIWPIFPIIVGIALILGGLLGRGRTDRGRDASPPSA